MEGAGEFGPGDAARVTQAAGQRVTVTAPAELLVWQMWERLGG